MIFFPFAFKSVRCSTNEMPWPSFAFKRDSTFLIICCWAMNRQKVTVINSWKQVRPVGSFDLENYYYCNDRNCSKHFGRKGLQFRQTNRPRCRWRCWHAFFFCFHHFSNYLSVRVRPNVNWLWAQNCWTRTHKSWGVKLVHVGIDSPLTLKERWRYEKRKFFCFHCQMLEF